MDGNDGQARHCYDCGKSLSDEGDPEVIWLEMQDGNGVWQTVPACRGHSRDARLAEAGLD